MRKSCVVISDFTTCSEIALGIQMPILRQMGIDCKPVPSKLLSMPLCDEGAVSISTADFATAMLDYWTNSGDKFDAVLAGFIPDMKLMERVSWFVEEQDKKGALIVIDPVMGDNGHAYKSVTKEHIDNVKKLVSCADILLPNVTESCILTGVEYEENQSILQIAKIINKLKALGAKRPIITGACVDGKDAVAYMNSEGNVCLVEYERIGGPAAGTGDRFAAVLTGRLLHGDSLEDAIKEAEAQVTANEKKRNSEG